MKTARALAAFVLCLCLPSPVFAVDLAALLGNSGFEGDLDHSQWTATRPNADFLLDAPQVNPEIIPKGETVPLDAPVGNNFIGILNPQDQNIEGKLVHDVVAGNFPIGTVFEVTVCANRGRLEAAASALFTSAPSEVLVQLYGWGAGTVPVINPSNDNWSRTPSVKIVRFFTNWPANGQWASQTISFPPTTRALQYVSFGITGKNHKQASYVAFDIGPLGTICP